MLVTRGNFVLETQSIVVDIPLELAGTALSPAERLQALHHATRGLPVDPKWLAPVRATLSSTSLAPGPIGLSGLSAVINGGYHFGPYVQFRLYLTHTVGFRPFAARHPIDKWEEVALVPPVTFAAAVRSGASSIPVGRVGFGAVSPPPAHRPRETSASSVGSSSLSAGVIPDVATARIERELALVASGKHSTAPVDRSDRQALIRARKQFEQNQLRGLQGAGSVPTVRVRVHAGCPGAASDPLHTVCVFYDFPVGLGMHHHGTWFQVWDLITTVTNLPAQQLYVHWERENAARTPNYAIFVDVVGAAIDLSLVEAARATFKLHAGYFLFPNGLRARVRDRLRPSAEVPGSSINPLKDKHNDQRMMMYTLVMHPTLGVDDSAELRISGLLAALFRFGLDSAHVADAGPSYITIFVLGDPALSYVLAVRLRTYLNRFAVMWRPLLGLLAEWQLVPGHIPTSAQTAQVQAYALCEPASPLAPLEVGDEDALSAMMQSASVRDRSGSVADAPPASFPDSDFSDSDSDIIETPAVSLAGVLATGAGALGPDAYSPVPVTALVASPDLPPKALFRSNVEHMASRHSSEHKGGKLQRVSCTSAGVAEGTPGPFPPTALTDAAVLGDFLMSQGWVHNPARLTFTSFSGAVQVLVRASPGGSTPLVDLFINKHKLRSLTGLPPGLCGPAILAAHAGAFSGGDPARFPTLGGVTHTALADVWPSLCHLRQVSAEAQNMVARFIHQQATFLDQSPLEWAAYDTLILLAEPWFLVRTSEDSVGGEEEGWLRVCHLHSSLIDLGAWIHLLPSLPIVLPTVLPGHMGGVSCKSLYRLMLREFPWATWEGLSALPLNVGCRSLRGYLMELVAGDATHHVACRHDKVSLVLSLGKESGYLHVQSGPCRDPVSRHALMMEWVDGDLAHPATYSQGKAFSCTSLGDGPGQNFATSGPFRAHPATFSQGKEFSSTSLGDGPGQVRALGTHPSAQHLGVEYACGAAASLVALGYCAPTSLFISLTVRHGRLSVPPAAILGESVADRAERWLLTSARFTFGIWLDSDFSANTVADTVCAATVQQQMIDYQAAPRMAVSAHLLLRPVCR